MTKEQFKDLETYFNILIEEYGKTEGYTFKNFLLYWYSKESENPHSLRKFSTKEIEEAFETYKNK